MRMQLAAEAAYEPQTDAVYGAETEPVYAPEAEAVYEPQTGAVYEPQTDAVVSPRRNRQMQQEADGGYREEPEIAGQLYRMRQNPTIAFTLGAQMSRRFWQRKRWQKTRRSHRRRKNRRIQTMLPGWKSRIRQHWEPTSRH